MVIIIPLSNRGIDDGDDDGDDDGGIDDSVHLRTSLGNLDDPSHDQHQDNASVISDMTSESALKSSTAVTNRRKTLRSSIFDSTRHLQQVDGQNMITSDMMVMLDGTGITLTDSQNLKHYSCEKPDILLGWQIMLHTSHKKKGNTISLLVYMLLFLILLACVVDIYVVTGMRKNALSKTEFRLSSLNKPDSWTTLKRATNKSGLPFQPMRHVLDITEQGVPN